MDWIEKNTTVVVLHFLQLNIFGGCVRTASPTIGGSRSSVKSEQASRRCAVQFVQKNMFLFTVCQHCVFHKPQQVHETRRSVIRTQKQLPNAVPRQTTFNNISVLQCILALKITSTSPYIQSPLYASLSHTVCDHHRPDIWPVLFQISERVLTL